MLLIIRTHLLPMLALGFALMAPNAMGQMAGLNATAGEIAQLPTFCWGQMHVPNTDRPEFKPHQCGPATNHYCPGLVLLIRAKHPENMQRSRQLLERAESSINYTENGIQPYPSCSIRGHVVATKAEVARLKKLYQPVSSGSKSAKTR